ncbi:MAG: class I SAM-dependent RNA methyltransferase [Clostridiales bacterium]|nr:class I SAM-dependent RNA methyltransferase [Clostridiales bacterium]MDY6117532.1 class I SAM-dependent RNA methyltransferase [Anaerovoracaceae bacterium]
MKKGDLIKVKIIDVSNEGNGVARVHGDSDSNNRVIFVSGATLGDEVLCEVTKIKKNYAVAKAENIIVPSQFRKSSEDVCPHLIEGCGGCNIGHLNYTKQLDLKSKRVRNALTRIGGFSLESDEVIFKEIIPSNNDKAYRNKAVFSIEVSKVGFLKTMSRDVVACPHCQILMPELKYAASGLSKFLKTYPKESKYIKKFMVRVGDDGQIMAVIFGSISSISHMQELCDFVSEECELISLYSVDIIEDKTCNNSKKLNSKIKSPQLLAGATTIQKTIGNLTFEVGPDAFFQVNEEQTRILYETVREFVGELDQEYAGELNYKNSASTSDELSDNKHKTNIVDLYCGVGTIGLSMSKDDNYIIGVESNREAVLNANRNAVINSIVNARYFHGAAENVLPKLIDEGIDDFKLKKIDLIVMDPPRAGCDKVLLDTIGLVMPKSIVYVSCDPATLARDLAILCNEYGYKLGKVCPMDMFPGSLNIETVCSLSRMK